MVFPLNYQVIKKLRKKKLKISIAESCTGGLLSGYLNSISGASKVFSLGVVTYSNKSKINILKISKNIINKYGAVSKEVCSAMVKNLSKITKNNVCISITGIAGPGGGSKNKPVGLVYIGIKKNNKSQIFRFIFKNKGRAYIQNKTVRKSLQLLLRIIK